MHARKLQAVSFAVLLPLLLLIPQGLGLQFNYLSISSVGEITYTMHRLYVNGSRIVNDLGLGVILKGVNIGPREYWDSSSVKSSDFYRIKSWGMNFVRLYLHWHFVESQAGVYSEDFLQRVDKYVTWAKQAGLYVVLGMSKANDGGDGWVSWDEFFNDPNIRERFYNVWSMVATRYSQPQFDNVIAFYLLSDPNHQAEAEQQQRQTIWWNTMIPEIINRIRAVNKHVMLIVEPIIGGWKDDTIFPTIRPVNDGNTLYGHCLYQPVYVTHQNGDYHGDIELLKADLSWSRPRQFSDTYNVPMFCNGWGIKIFEEPPKESRQLWVHHNAQLMNNYSISWAYWIFSYWDAFGLLNSDGSERTVVSILEQYVGP